MNRFFISLLFLCLPWLHTIAQDSFPQERKEAIGKVLKEYVAMGLPGVVVAVYTPATGLWSHAEGYANSEKNIALTTAHVHYLQSTSKTYMAVAILLLYEQGKIGLDDLVLNYLNTPWLNSIAGSDKVTVRMLLNHTSGLPEYNTDPLLVSKIVQDPLTVLSPPELMEYRGGKALEFEPGAKYVYRNTNYEILSLIADAITGDHVEFIQREILDKLQLNSTYYLTKENYMAPMNLVDSYWDVLLEAKPVNISGLQRANVASMKGDDGMVASPENAVTFLKGLVGGALVRPRTLELMQEWVQDSEGNPRYGLGLSYYDLDSTYGIGHSGGGIGAGCVLIYLPELGAVVFMATNFNTMMESPIRKKAENIKLDILEALFME
jgi:D-alanyl-D-alanine carboxypeptidase